MNYSYSFDVIRSILDSNIGTVFNNNMQKCLSVLCNCKGLKYKATKQLGGDGGADFIIFEKNEYYCFSSGEKYSQKDIEEKVNHDLSSLFENVVENRLYTGKIDKVIFVFGMHGERLPNDKKGDINKLINNKKKQYGSFICEILSVVDFCEKLVGEEEQSVINRIEQSFGVNTSIPETFIEIHDLLSKIEDKQDYAINYQRISTESKVSKNKLKKISNKINEALTSEYYSKMNEVIIQEEYEQKFISLKIAIMDLYRKNKNNYDGVELFDNIVKDLEKEYHISHKTSELLVIFVFDHCDIFSN